MIIVLDNSFVVEWLLGGERAAGADRLISTDFESLWVPSLFWTELAYVLGKHVHRDKISRTFRDESLQQVFSLGIRTDTLAAVPGPAFSRTLGLGDQHGLTIYDAVYLELALRRGGGVATLDARLARVGRAVGLEVIYAV